MWGFTDYRFVLVFLPVVAVWYSVLLRFGRPPVAIAWLAVASILYYAGAGLGGLAVLAGSIGLNYLVSQAISRSSEPQRRRLLIIGVGANIGLFLSFRSSWMLLTAIHLFASSKLDMQSVIAPLGLSFFSFQQIAYLIDVYRREAMVPPVRDYVLFIAYFPKITAGPLVRHDEMLPQLWRLPSRARLEDFNVGFTLFVLGLAKKFFLADGAAPTATALFTAVGKGYWPTFIEAWFGVLAYSVQIYFDFSGYSDMAIGISRIFSIRLPMNFNSPYKAASLIDFWRRWHMSLTRFLTDYVYFALPGHRRGLMYRHANLMLTMLVCGLWHGLAWNFAAWGCWHGALLVANHGWRAWRGPRTAQSAWSRGAARILTLAAVMGGWALFAAPDLQAAVRVMAAMSGVHGISLPHSLEPGLAGVKAVLAALGVTFQGMGGLAGGSGALPGLVLIVVGLCIASFGPNTQQWMAKGSPVLGAVGYQSAFQWRPAVAYGLMIGVVLFAVIRVWLEVQTSRFLYAGF